MMVRSPRLIRLRQYAYGKVNRAIQAGKLKRLDGNVRCSDCGRPAEYYDHRDYRKPLAVVPVCHACNMHRGPAKGVQWKRGAFRCGGACEQAGCQYEAMSRFHERKCKSYKWK